MNIITGFRIITVLKRFPECKLPASLTFNKFRHQPVQLCYRIRALITGNGADHNHKSSVALRCGQSSEKRCLLPVRRSAVKRREEKAAIIKRNLCKQLRGNDGRTPLTGIGKRGAVSIKGLGQTLWQSVLRLQLIQGQLKQFLCLSGHQGGLVPDGVTGAQLSGQINERAGQERQHHNKNQSGQQGKSRAGNINGCDYLHTYLRSSSGFSLLDMMIAVFLSSLVMTAGFILIENLKSVQVKMTQMAELDGQSEQLYQMIRTRAAGYDSFDVIDISDNDSACLRARRTNSSARQGVYIATPPAGLSDEHPVIYHQGWTGLSGNADRSLSVWVLLEHGHAGISRLVSWGDNSTTGGLFSVLIEDGQPRLDLAGAEIIPATDITIDDDMWHHIGLSYSTGLSDETLIFTLDGGAVSLSLPDGITILATGANPDGDKGLVIGAAHNRISDLFSGGITDLRLYDTALSESDFFSLSQGEEPSGAPELRLRYPLLSAPDSAHQSDNSSYAEDALIQNHTALLSLEALARTSQTALFGFYDTDSDNRYTLFQLATDTASGSEHVTCPDTPSVTATALTSDHFTHPEEGFFAPIGQTASFQLTAGLEAGPDYRLNQTGIGTAPAASRLRLTEHLTDSDFCRIAPELRFSGSEPDCLSRTAYVHILSDASKSLPPGSHEDRLTIETASATETDMGTEFTDIPFTTGLSVTATYHNRLRLLELNADAPGLGRSDWQRILRAVGFQTTATQTSDRRDFLFSVGAPGFQHNDGVMRYFRFEPTSDGEDISVTDAASEAGSDNQSLCGMTGYLATVTDYAEMAALSRLTATAEGPQRGWMGGADNISEGDWQWRDGPEADLRFWSGTGVSGGPVSDDNVSLTVSSRNRRDIGFSSDNDSRLMIVIPDNNSAEMRFQFWAATQTSFPYPDDADDDEDYLVMSVDNHSNGLWASAVSDAACLDSDEAMAVFSPCGYYIEWGGQDNQSQPVLTEQVTLSIDEFNLVCNSDE